ncbi:MAG: thiol-activated cytolysin family protein [Bacteroidota bacterium]
MKPISPFYILLILLSLFACKGTDPCDDPNNPCGPEEDFLSVIAEGGAFEDFNTRTDSSVVDSSLTTQANGERFLCITKDYDFVSSAEKYFSFNPNPEIIFPGSLLQGASITNPTPDPIVLDRGPGCLTINVVNGSQGTRACVDEMSEGKIVEALNQILDNNNGVLPAQFSYDFTEVQSSQEMAFKMGVNFNSLTADARAKLSINASSSYHSYLINLNQNFYTMIYEKPTSYGDVFAEGVSADDLARFIQPGNPATYISSVTYGRKFYLLVESTASRIDMRASIQATYDAAVSNTELDASATYVKDLANVNIKVYAIGGDQSQALATFNGDFDAIATFLTEGGDYLTGVPLSYVVRSLETHKIVNVKLATQYQTSVCEPYLYDDNPPGFTNFWGQQIKQIGAIANLNTSTANSMVIFNLEGDQYYLTDQNTQTFIGGPYELDDPNAPYGVIPFDKVSAVRFDAGSNSILFYNGPGTLIAGYSFTYSQIGSPVPIANVYSDHPFLLFGIEAAGRYAISAGLFHAKKGGKETVVYNPDNGFFFPPSSVDESEGFPLTSVGAAAFIDFGDGYFILIDNNGRDYTILDVANSSEPLQLYKF